ncbi:MAG: FTR1 family protein [Rhodocyclaceae bacterium]|nr:FTR1 family protein [Rhodocyclaceae bacterium]
MLNALIIVWRESLEAMLVIGVLLAWIARQPEPAMLRQGLWLGAAAGVALAMMLGFATFAAQSQFAGATLEMFQLAMVLFAAALIVQMVLWMHRHGRAMKRELEEQASRTTGAIGIGSIAALAVAREGAETVVFLYGLGVEAMGNQRAALLGAAAAGFVLAAATSWIVARGARFLSYRTLFRVSEFLLLLIANALLANGIDRMIGMDWLPPLLDPVWDSSALLDDGRGAGRLLADFVGYRARPAGVLLIASIGFWALVFWRLARLDRPAPAAR